MYLATKLIQKPVYVPKTCLCSTFGQRIAIRMRMRTCGCHTMVTETSKRTNFRICFYNMFLYWLTSLLIDVTFLYWQAFFRWVKETNEITILQACCFITDFYID